MNVYPLNMIAGAAVFSGSVLSYSSIKNTIHPYLKHKAYFNVGKPFSVNILFSPSVKIDTFIIGRFNAGRISGSMSTDAGPAVLSFERKEAIQIYDAGSDVLVDSITLTAMEDVPADEIPYIEYLFAGNKVELPLFAVSPEWETQIRGESNRTNNGQVYGTVLPTLDRLSTKYLRISSEDKRIVDNYVQSVQTNIPHVVDLYHEAHDSFPPRYATLNRGISAIKRNEDGFFWDYDMEWLEAR